MFFLHYISVVQIKQGEHLWKHPLWPKSNSLSVFFTSYILDPMKCLEVKTQLLLIIFEHLNFFLDFLFSFIISDCCRTHPADQVFSTTCKTCYFEQLLQKYHIKIIFLWTFLEISILLRLVIGYSTNKWKFLTILFVELVGGIVWLMLFLTFWNLEKKLKVAVRFEEGQQGSYNFIYHNCFNYRAHGYSNQVAVHFTVCNFFLSSFS